MKDQYFGDKRDFFKYHLALTLVERLNLEAFTLVTMLTSPEGGNDGNQMDERLHRLRPDLHDFLTDCVADESKRRVASLRAYMEARHPDVRYVGYEDSQPMTSRTREGYFSRIQPFALHRAVILIDPDNGFEVQRSGEQHLLYSDFAQVFEAMDDESVLVAYQHRGRFETMRATFMKKAGGIVAAIPSARPFCISDNEIGFIIVTKSDELRGRVQSALGGFGLSKPCIFYGTESETMAAASPQE